MVPLECRCWCGCWLAAIAEMQGEPLALKSAWSVFFCVAGVGAAVASKHVRASSIFLAWKRGDASSALFLLYFSLFFVTFLLKETLPVCFLCFLSFRALVGPVRCF